MIDSLEPPKKQVRSRRKTNYKGAAKKETSGLTPKTDTQGKLIAALTGGNQVFILGPAGTGKTSIVKDYFKDVDPDSILTTQINFNSYTDSADLQVVLESNVDKRAGRTFGPPPSKTLIYFMDDLNMPFLDKYGTQSPICLIRQIIDYGIIYDRDHLEEKKYLVDCMLRLSRAVEADAILIHSCNAALPFW